MFAFLRDRNLSIEVGSQRPTPVLSSSLSALEDLTPVSRQDQGATSTVPTFGRHFLTRQINLLHETHRLFSPAALPSISISPEQLLEIVDRLMQGAEVSSWDMITSAALAMENQPELRGKIPKEDCSLVARYSLNELRRYYSLDQSPERECASMGDFVIGESGRNNSSDQFVLSDLSPQHRARLLVQVLNRPWIRHGASYPKKFRSELEDKFLRAINDNLPIKIVLVGFPDPVVLPHKKGKDEADLLEVSALARLSTILQSIKHLHPAGGEFHIFTGNSVYDQMFHDGVPDFEKRRDFYQESLNIFLRVMNLEDRILFHDYPEIEEAVNRERGCSQGLECSTLVQAWDKKVAARQKVEELLESFSFSNLFEGSQSSSLHCLIRKTQELDPTLGDLFSELFESCLHSTEQPDVEEFAARYGIDSAQVYLKLLGDILSENFALPVDSVNPVTTAETVFFGFPREVAMLLHSEDSRVGLRKLASFFNEKGSLRSVESFRSTKSYRELLKRLFGLEPGDDDEPKVASIDELSQLIKDRFDEVHDEFGDLKRKMIERGWRSTLGYLVEFLSKRDSYKGIHIGGADVASLYVPEAVRGSTVSKRDEDTPYTKLQLLLTSDMKFPPNHAAARLSRISPSGVADGFTVSGTPHVVLRHAHFTPVLLKEETSNTTGKSSLDVARPVPRFPHASEEDNPLITIRRLSSAPLNSLERRALRTLLPWMGGLSDRELSNWKNLRDDLDGADIISFEAKLSKQSWFLQLPDRSREIIVALATVSAEEVVADYWKFLRQESAWLREIGYNACSVRAQPLYYLAHKRQSPLIHIPLEELDSSLAGHPTEALLDLYPLARVPESRLAEGLSTKKPVEESGPTATTLIEFVWPRSLEGVLRRFPVLFAFQTARPSSRTQESSKDA